MPIKHGLTYPIRTSLTLTTNIIKQASPLTIPYHHILQSKSQRSPKMATRRIISQEKTLLDQPDPNTLSSSSPAQKSNITPAVPSAVIFKLLAFTLAMMVVPIGSYFATVNTLFKGNSTYAGGLAAIMANVVLIGYVLVAMAEDQSDRLEEEKKQKQEGKKDR
ncbi:vacuolar ATPase assembly integral membrane protein vma21 [Podospora pseudocomata]|uniref:Vacuolar ATPase assembly integral membrane protein vma21 n=1 Tax=Podospora pseudocomata TaxID=2093779 RepID=A0ABR0GUD7_9PEZI|nr:vacuolar ATPase assembly integral membrane protein vma21 [Podospora pseudocomata]